MPTGLMIGESFDELDNTTAMFKWDRPHGSGPEAVVDNYTITITPAPLSHPTSNVVFSLLWNVTLKYNVEYAATLMATNCAGDGGIITLSGIEFSKIINQFM